MLVYLKYHRDTSTAVGICVKIEEASVDVLDTPLEAGYVATGQAASNNYQVLLLI